MTCSEQITRKQSSVLHICSSAAAYIIQYLDKTQNGRRNYNIKWIR